MLFNSYQFIFVFFPLTFVLFFILARRSNFAAAAGLGLASLVFYGWTDWQMIPLLMGSILTNYWLSHKLIPSNDSKEVTRRNYLYLSLFLNLALLAFFKYANFFIANTNSVLHTQLHPLNIVLPIGISFFTFTQIAFLVDCWKGKVRERHFVHYLLFVTYFPHLVAGPVIHHHQMMPQFADRTTYRIDTTKIGIGLVLFTLGLFKKLLIADPLSEFADAFFGHVREGMAAPFFMSWLGVLSYTFQIYFDFSGYSDMAVGLSLFFGIRLPINFNSPYKSLSIVEFWRRWHISLSTFLRDYLYIPLGGNRYGSLRRHLNLVVTMILGGLWHGASWTFVLWGTAHGLYLVINHFWKHFIGFSFGRLINWGLTFTSVCLAWVLFRADSLDTAHSVCRGLFGLNGLGVPFFLSEKIVVPFSYQVGLLTTANGGDYLLLGLIFMAGILSVCFPNTNRFVETLEHGRPLKRFHWAVAPAYACLLLMGILKLSKASPFLYFQF